MGAILDFLRNYYLLDLLDVLIVAFLFYRLYIIIRGTRAVQMFLGLAVLFLFSSLAQSLGLTLLDRIIVSLQTVWLIAFIIIFQPELRRALTYLGQTKYLRHFIAGSRPEMVDEILLAVSRLQKAGLGAILVIQRNTGLKPHIETGTVIDAKIRASLLETIFTPPTPLHDGAVILHRDRIVAAGCILPLSRNEHLAYTLGTEESDALAVVVSEESRQLSVAEEGQLRSRLSPEDLEAKLLEIYGQPENLPAFGEDELPTVDGEAQTGEKARGWKPK